MRRAALGALVFAASFLTLAFLVLPAIAVFTKVSPATLASQLSNRVVTDALVVTAKTTLAAQALVLLLGTPTAYALARRRFAGRSVLVTLVELPLVLPPAVAGLGLLVAFGRTGLFHTSIPFTQFAVVLAVAFVSSPLYVRAAIAAFEAVDADVVAAARTLGAGAALAFARGIGEFGATIMFAGSLQGKTQTLALAVYSAFDQDFTVALAVSALLVLVSAALLVTIKWLPSLSTSRFRFAASS